jgi:hypothetical protein
VSAGRLRVLTIALFVAAAVLTAVAGKESGPVFAAGVACFLVGVAVFFRWRRAEHTEVRHEAAQGGKVFDREEKTVEEESGP